MQLKSHKARGLENTFYIVDLSTPTNSWWQLRLIDTHQVISTNGTKEGILDSIYRITKRYKTRSRILTVMKATDYQINDITLVQRKEEYKTHQYLLEEVEETVKKAMESVNEVRPTPKPLLGKVKKEIIKQETAEENKPLVLKKVTKHTPTTKPIRKLTL